MANRNLDFVFIVVDDDKMRDLYSTLKGRNKIFIQDEIDNKIIVEIIHKRVYIATKNSDWKDTLLAHREAVVLIYHSEKITGKLPSNVYPLQMSAIPGDPGKIKKVVYNIFTPENIEGNVDIHKQLKENLSSFISRYQWRTLFYELLYPLLPFQLSLQAFFGISRDENGNWKKLPDDLPKELKEKFSGLLSEENREKAFLLVPEAKWDFYAEIGSRLGKLDPASTSEPYDEQPLLNLVEELFKNEKILKHNDFKDCKGNKINGRELKGKIEGIIKDEVLRTLCAILANIDPKESESPKISKEEKDKHKPMIIKSQNILKEHLKGEIHTKWSDLKKDPKGNIPFDSYINLKNQLHEWNKEGKVQKIIKNIESLSDYLEQIV